MFNFNFTSQTMRRSDTSPGHQAQALAAFMDSPFPTVRSVYFMTDLQDSEDAVESYAHDLDLDS